MKVIHFDRGTVPDWKLAALMNGEALVLFVIHIVVGAGVRGKFYTSQWITIAGNFRF